MSDFVDYLVDVFSEFGTINYRRMFGGHGLYFEDAMFGLVADDPLYLKVDDQNIQMFLDEDLPGFEYEKDNGKVVVMSFRLAPESIYDDPSEAAIWASHAWEAARRAKKGKSKAKKKVATKKKAAAKKKKLSSKKKTTSKKKPKA